MEINDLKLKIKTIIHKIQSDKVDKIPEEVDHFEQYGDFSKFPELKTAILLLLTKDFHYFVTDIEWVSPKPTTFCVSLNNSEYFFLIFNERGWVVQLRGIKYFISNIQEEKKASEAISRLLYYNNNLVDDLDEDNENYDWSDDKKSSSSGSSGGSSDQSGGDDEVEDSSEDTDTDTADTE